jgi:alcohol dehydrogenase class IV
MLAKVKAGLGGLLAGVFCEVAAHTPMETAQRGLQQVRETGADLLVTVGGGSAIDTGKVIAIMLACGGDLARYAITGTSSGEIQHAAMPQGLIRHIAVPTTAGSGSDVMPTAGCRDPQSRRKLLFWDPQLVPQVTILDPEMAIYAEALLTAATGMTAIARCIESLYSGKRQPVSTGLALHALRLLCAALPRSIAAPDDVAARADCQMGALMSGIAAINAMASVVHAIGHVVGGRYAPPHGVSHAILLAPAMRLLLPVLGDEQQLVVDTMSAGQRGASSFRSAMAMPADLMADLVSRLPLPQRLRDIGLSSGELAEIAQLTMSDYMMANLPRPLSRHEVLALVTEAW